MKLEKLTIKYMSYGANKGRYVAEVAARGEQGSVELTLPPGTSEAILPLVEKELVAATETAAARLRDELSATLHPEGGA